MIGIITNGLEAYIVITVVLRIFMICMVKKLKPQQISESMTWMSLVNLFKILPRGTLSKNSFKGAYILDKKSDFYIKCRIDRRPWISGLFWRLERLQCRGLRLWRLRIARIRRRDRCRRLGRNRLK